MEYLNWVAEHWLLSIVLTMIITSGLSRVTAAIVLAIAGRANSAG